MKALLTLAVALFSYIACARRQRRLSENCSLAPKEGRCRAEFRYWTYNKTIKRCEPISGCYIKHAFETLDECNKKCRNKDYGGCAALSNSRTCQKEKLKKGFWFDPDKQNCVKFYNETCENYRKTFKNENECYRDCGEFVQDRCQLPIVPATATCHYKEDPVTMFGYNKLTGQCVEFLYLSCGGNKNAFKSRALCLETCNPKSTCLKHTQENNEWFRMVKSFYYNKAEDNCRLTKTIFSKDYWPKENRFTTEVKCKEMCMPAHKPVIRTHY